MNKRSALLKEGFVSGVRKGMQGFVWMVKILVPISLFTAVLQWTGLIDGLEIFFRPLMSLLSLPAMAALPLIVGMLTGVYGGIAAMVMLPFTRDQMTLMAIFILIAHNLIQEGVVQSRSGINPLKATAVRLIAAAFTVIVVAQFFDTAEFSSINQETAGQAGQTFVVMLECWLVSATRLVIKIFFIILSLLIILEVLKSMGWIPYIVKPFAPILKLLGLNGSVGIMWITAVVFGLAYGAAVIVEEARKGEVSREELEELHLSVGINHSMVEDPTLFLALGLSAFWLWVPRLITAILAVHVLRLWQRARKAWV